MDEERFVRKKNTDVIVWFLFRDLEAADRSSFVYSTIDGN